MEHQHKILQVNQNFPSFELTFDIQRLRVYGARLEFNWDGENVGKAFYKGFEILTEGSATITSIKNELAIHENKITSLEDWEMHATEQLANHETRISECELKWQDINNVIDQEIVNQINESGIITNFVLEKAKIVAGDGINISSSREITAAVDGTTISFKEVNGKKLLTAIGGGGGTVYTSGDGIIISQNNEINVNWNTVSTKISDGSIVIDPSSITIDEKTLKEKIKEIENAVVSKQDAITTVSSPISLTKNASNSLTLSLLYDNDTLFVDKNGVLHSKTSGGQNYTGEDGISVNENGVISILDNGIYPNKLHVETIQNIGGGMRSYYGEFAEITEEDNFLPIPISEKHISILRTNTTQSTRFSNKIKRVDFVYTFFYNRTVVIDFTATFNAPTSLSQDEIIRLPFLFPAGSDRQNMLPLSLTYMERVVQGAGTPETGKQFLMSLSLEELDSSQNYTPPLTITNTSKFGFEITSEYDFKIRGRVKLSSSFN